ncbi:YcaO-like family protein [Chitinophaga silvisoli]|uniref:YcaO domain-containing protein n=1 Tax=Chitinophaga silvisoli TaxID=2291814 RepID=A0A3E1NZW2_9BACT|nr:YcaO-like family protein [Chitinophaga silvisoli]RFM33481.1 hypothetical protein DXN04_16095 [Chitinophaga silvisoli]
MISNTSSWREVSLEVTLNNIQQIASSIGISRVTDITRLDKIGIPVFSSIRPGAAIGSLCVNAGKGLYPLEAKVGAYMEAFEFAMAEFSPDRFNTTITTPRKIANQPNVHFEFIDLCPVYQVPVQPDDNIVATKASDILTGEKIDIPAELVYSPLNIDVGQKLFGCRTNGLCSGNTEDEATIHGICEIIERDIEAFNYIRDASKLVTTDALPPAVKSLVSKIESAGFALYLRYTANVFGLPYFQAFIDEGEQVPVAISQGSGLHLSASVAAVRAITEAAQSRLSYIHGGRDDLTERSACFEKDQEWNAVTQLRRRISDPAAGTICYSTIPDLAGMNNNTQSVLDCLMKILADNGIEQVLKVALAPAHYPLKALRIIIPKLESFNFKSKRVGPRLISLIQNNVLSCPGFSSLQDLHYMD